MKAHGMRTRNMREQQRRCLSVASMFDFEGCVSLMCGLKLDKKSFRLQMNEPHESADDNMSVESSRKMILAKGRA